MRTSGAKAVVEVLKEEGVRHVFQLPGSQIIDILDEIYQSPIRQIMTRHEQGAAFMADGYARASRGVGVCLSTVGPGAMNLVAGIASSYKAGVPVIAITGIHHQKYAERDAFHEMDQVGAFKPITKWSACAHLPEQIPEMMRKAFRVALTGRRGPVHLAIPIDVSRGEVDYEASEPAGRRANVPACCPEEVVQEILDRVAKARAPVILAGNEILWSGAAKDLARLAEALGLLVATTRDASGAFPKSHPLGVGLIGKGRGESGNAAVQGADLILALGAKFEFQSTRHNYEIIPKGAAIVHVSANAEEVGRIYPAAIGVVADVGAVIRALLAKLAGRDPVETGAAETAGRLKAEARAVLDRELKPEAVPLQPQAVARALRQCLPPETVIVVDGGNFAKHVRRHFDIVEVDTFHYPDEFGTVGSSFPMALGVKAALPDRPVACLIGDGGFLLNSQELETAVRERLNVLTVVFNDFGFGNIRAYQQKDFCGRYSCEYDNPPFDQLARLFKAGGAKVTRLGDLGPAVASALAGDVPSVIDVLVTKGELQNPGFLKGSE